MMRAPEPWELYPMPTEQKAAIKSYIDRMIEQRLRPLQSQVESLREDRAGYREAYRIATEDLSRLDAWLRNRFPKQPREGVPTVDAAIELLKLAHEYFPQILQLLAGSLALLEKRGLTPDDSLQQAVQSGKDD